MYAFITKRNLHSILKKVDYNKIEIFDEGIYYKKIFILGTREKKELLGLKLLLEDINKFTIEYYDEYITYDKYEFVYEGIKPAYHCIINCNKLTAKYNNFKIPEIIKKRAIEKGGEQLMKKEVERFRKWFEKNKSILEENPQLFLNRLSATWFVDIPIQKVEVANSGIKYFENLNLEELVNKIDNLLRSASKMYNESPDEKQKILKRYGTAAYYFSKAGIKIDEEYLGVLSENQVKDFLKDYEQKIKIPLRNALKDYLRVKINPNLTFEGHLLEKLNFKPCSLCYKEIDSQKSDDPKTPDYSNRTSIQEDSPFPTIDDFRDYGK